MSARVTRISLLLGSGACLIAMLVVLALYWRTRPQPPNLESLSEWTLVKSAEFPSAEGGQREIRVYLYKRESTDIDPYNVRQNKIIIIDSGKSHEFMWPAESAYAGGWTEVFLGDSDAIAVALFESEAVVRVVEYAGGEFRFRLKEDELISSEPLTFRGVAQDGVAVFASRAGSAWQWSRQAGFRQTEP